MNNVFSNSNICKFSKSNNFWLRFKCNSRIKVCNSHMIEILCHVEHEQEEKRKNAIMISFFMKMILWSCDCDLMKSIVCILGYNLRYDIMYVYVFIEYFTITYGLCYHLLKKRVSDLK